MRIIPLLPQGGRDCSFNQLRETKVGWRLEAVGSEYVLRHLDIFECNFINSALAYAEAARTAEPNTSKTTGSVNGVAQ